MDRETKNRRACREGQARLDAMTDPADEPRCERDEQEPDFEQILQDRAERRAMRGEW